MPAFITASCVALSSAWKAARLTMTAFFGSQACVSYQYFEVLVRLGVEAGRAARHVALDHPGRHRLTQLGGLHGDGLRTEQLGDARGRRTVGTPLDALEVGTRREWPLRVDALRRPGDRVQHHHALLAKLLVEHRLLCLPQLLGGLVAVGQERQAVRTEQLPLVLEVHQQDLADLRLPPCTARLISGALNSDAFGWTVIFSLPPLARSTSAANCTRFSVWKLLAG
jgi:hypothetical protein